ncbi:hypothetical protein GCM10010271_17900 [Streptomyces kurssanovii]|nr:hypothetical protein GCM10010271_17900 [Streptomyces kurssanovii]
METPQGDGPVAGLGGRVGLLPGEERQHAGTGLRGGGGGGVDELEGLGPVPQSTACTLMPRSVVQ